MAETIHDDGEFACTSRACMYLHYMHFGTMAICIIAIIQEHLITKVICAPWGRLTVTLWALLIAIFGLLVK